MKEKTTMKDIADMLGVSINAVSLALNDKKGVSEETRLRILETAQAQGYLDSEHRYVRTFGHYHICVLIQDVYAENGFYGRILYSITTEAKKCGYDILLHHFNDENMTIPDCITTHRVSGIIILGKISIANVENLQALNFHIVVIDHAPRSCRINCILTDNISGGYMATNYLIQAGFRKIGYFGDLSYTLSVKERYYGFLEALTQEKVISFDQTDAYVRKYSITDIVDEHIKNMDTEVIAKILSKRKELPQAYFCSNDRAAETIIQALKEKNIKVPEDISVIGFDDEIRVTPKLTTVKVNRELMGQKAVRRLLQLIKEEDQEIEHTVLGVELVVRDSVRSVNAN